MNHELVMTILIPLSDSFFFSSFTKMISPKSFDFTKVISPLRTIPETFWTSQMCTLCDYPVHSPLARWLPIQSQLTSLLPVQSPVVPSVVPVPEVLLLESLTVVAVCSESGLCAVHLYQRPILKLLSSMPCPRWLPLSIMAQSRWPPELSASSKMTSPEFHASFKMRTVTTVYFTIFIEREFMYKQ